MVACASPQSLIQTAIAGTQSIWTPVTTQTAYFTYTPQPTIFITKIVTETYTPIPVFTSTISFTPTNTLSPTKTATPSLTINPLAVSHGNGVYLVGIDIAAGLWRSFGSQTDCYWTLTTRTGDIINNYFGMAGGTMYVSPSVFEVLLEDCGTWNYLGLP